MNKKKKYLTMSYISNLTKKYLDNKASAFYEYLLVPFVNSLIKEIEEKAGKKYQRDGEYQRWSENPGSLVINNEKIRFKVPRLKNKQTGKVESPQTYKKGKRRINLDRSMIELLLNGISQRKYREAARLIRDSFGISQSSLSRIFQEEAEKALKELENRPLSGYKFLSIVMDGKYLKKEQIVYAVGITNKGYKIILGFIQTHTENSEAVKGLLKNLLERGLRYEEGILFVVDGSKGIIKAIKEVFGEYGIIQRCQWHKRENVLSYLSEEDRERFKGRIQRAYLEPDYETAKSKLKEIHKDLMDINRTAANSLLEGLEETLTLHKLGVSEELRKSLSTTNVIENTNSQLSYKLRNVKYWHNSQMIAKWIGISLLDVETTMNRIKNYKN